MGNFGTEGEERGIAVALADLHGADHIALAFDADVLHAPARLASTGTRSSVQCASVPSN